MTRRKANAKCAACGEITTIREYFGMEGGMYSGHYCKTEEGRKRAFKILSNPNDNLFPSFDEVFKDAPVWPEDEQEHMKFAETQGGY